VLRRIFGPKRDEVTGEWRKLHKEELHDLYSSPSIIRIINEKIKPPLFATISHCVFIIHVSYYMFRLHISHLQVYHV
jgi:hypothetical protein